MTDLKTVLVDAFEAQGPNDPYVFDRGDGEITLDGRFDLDRLSTALTDHFLDREKVKAVLLAGLPHAVDMDGLTIEHWAKGSPLFDHPVKVHRTDQFWCEDATIIDVDTLADRLIDGLTGKAGHA